MVILDISCPGDQSPCNGNGLCDLTSGVCTCDEQHQGDDCSGKIERPIPVPSTLS